MDEKEDPTIWTRRLQANYDYVKDKLCRLPDVLRHFIDAQVLTESEAKRILHTGDRDKTCNERFIHCLLNKGEPACRLFLEILQKTSNPHVAAELESTDPRELDTLGACGPSPSPDDQKTVYNIMSAENVFITDRIVQHTGQEREYGKGNENDLMVSLLKEILTNISDRNSWPMYTLEQKLCQRLKKVTKRQIPNFQEFAGMAFRVFLERNDEFFTMSEESNEVLVAIRKSKKKKNKPRKKGTTKSESVSAICLSGTSEGEPAEAVLTENLQTPRVSGGSESITEEQKIVGDRKTRGQQTVHPPLPSSTRRKSTDIACQEVTSAETSSSFVERSIDEAVIRDLLSRVPGDTLIFRRSARQYTEDSVQFTLDIVSLWNTPHRSDAYIILGVDPESKFVVGLRSPLPEGFFHNLFKWELFQPLPPRFSYREVVFAKKHVGLVKVEVSHGCGFPSVVTSSDMAPRLEKNQLWARRNGSNKVIENLDLFVGNIFAWFQARPSVDDKKMPSANRNQAETSVTELNLTTTDSFPKRKVESATGPPPKNTANVQDLMKALNHFEKGHFVLVCGSLNTRCRTIESLANAPWIAVYDFDFNGRDSGLLAVLEESLKRKRSVSVNTWCDHCRGLTERGTQWWSLRGRREIPQSQIAGSSHQKWFSLVRDKIEKLCLELARYNEDYTVLTFLLLWPSSEMEARCMHKFLTKLQEHVQLRLILCFTDQEFDIDQCRLVEMIRYEYEDMARVFQISLEEICSEIQLHLQDSKTPDTFQYKLPAEDKSTVELTETDAAWLAEDLDVLYLKNPYSTHKLTATDLKEEAEHFFRGGTIRWYMWYEVGPGYLDVKRSIADQVTTHIQTTFIDKYKGGNVSLFHAPGSGGSTMAQRLIWDLHEVAPCAKVRQRSGSSPENIADKLVFLHKHSHMPVVTLFDGEDEPRLKQILAFLQRSPVVVLQLKRYLYHLGDSKMSCSSMETNVFLTGFVTNTESRNLVLRFSDRCETDMEKVARLQKLDTEVQEETAKHQMFEYGMTVYAHEFQGVRAYVRGYLDLPKNPNEELKPWQKCLGYISLVYFYGQTSIPCQFFVHIMGKPANHIMDLKEFPDQFQILVVQDSNEGRRGYLRIAHYIIAREILEQILNRESSQKESRRTYDASNKPRSNELSKEAKHCLKNYCIDFISDVARKKVKSTMTSATITYILTKTFIIRDDEEVGAQDTYTRKKFSQIMSDVDSKPLYNGRLEILQSLCKTFPYDPNLRAHLGRFYSLCRPEEEDETESHFKAALSLCFSNSECRSPDTMDERLKLTLMHIYHMFGNGFQRRITKYTGWRPGDEPVLRTSQANMHERLTEVFHNASTACRYFLQARLYTPQGQEDCYTYMNDIHVRLLACDFVNSVYPGGLKAFLSKKIVDQRVQFVRDSVFIIEDLIMECYSIIFLDRGTMLQMNVRWYCSLFNKCIAQLKNFVTGEDLTSLRLSISRKKLKFRSVDNVVAVENPDVPAKDIESIVSKLESVFRYQNSSHDLSKRMLDLYYKDWILAIRNPNFTKVYSVEEALVHVRQWHDCVHSPLSTFFLFVLLTLLGFGTRDRPGSTDYLVEANMLQEDAMHRMSKTVVRPRYPREWLGLDTMEGIRRLVTSSSVGHVEEGCIKSGQSRAKLAVCKGTIRAKNKKLAGHIDLDIRQGSTSVKVFYIPLFANMEGSRYEGDRVQFQLAFTMEKGYEAYDVKPLKRTPCSGCNNKVEMLWNQQEIVCPKCEAVIVNREPKSNGSRHACVDAAELP